MNGYTKGARNEIFALRPAPVQVMWLGYPGTSGAAYMDYIITDRITSPLDFANQYSEKLAYLPDTFFVGDHQFMFPHLLKPGEGTTDHNRLTAIDCQAGVIRINDQVQAPMNASLVMHLKGQQQPQQAVSLQVTPHVRHTHTVQPCLYRGFTAFEVPYILCCILPLTPAIPPPPVTLLLTCSPALHTHWSSFPPMHSQPPLPLLPIQCVQVSQVQQHQANQMPAVKYLPFQQQVITQQLLYQLQQQQLQQQQMQLQLQQQQHKSSMVGYQQQMVMLSAAPTSQTHANHQVNNNNNGQENAAPLLYDLPLTTRAQYGLPEHAVVFCNFNQLYKIEPATMRSWLNILKRVPQSVLWLLRFPAAGETNLHKFAADHNIEVSRIIFSNVAPKEEHVRRGRVADLCLDTPLCNGHTTGMDVLWAGTPVLTLPLETLASRIAASQVTALGFPELVSTSREDYEEKAVFYGNNPAA